MKVCIGLASGIGNAVFMLPTIRAVRYLGHEVLLYCDGDFAMADLFRRCRWVSCVSDAQRDPIPQADRYLAGHWCPPSMLRVHGLIHSRWTNEPAYDRSEWALGLEAARSLGWPQDLPEQLQPWNRVDRSTTPWEQFWLPVADWCEGVERTAEFDVGIVPGCKPGLWARKRYPAMPDVARWFVDSGHRVAVFGEASDLDGQEIAGESFVGKVSLRNLPDALARCRILIGTDSGPTHLGSSLGIPTVVVYTSTSEIKGDPVGRPSVKLTQSGLSCRPCQATTRWHDCRDWVCQTIPASTVIDAGLRLLEVVDAKHGRRSDH